MSTNFPTSLDNLDTTRGTTGQSLSNPNHIVHHTNEDDAIEALQSKVGVNNSAVTTSLDYKLTNASSISPGHKHVSADISDLLPISSSTGVADAGKLVKTNGSGEVDSTFLTTFQTNLTNTLTKKTYSVVENMNGSVTPIAVCVNTDGNVQKGEADQTGIIDKFIGFVTENISDVEISFLNNASSTTNTLSFTPSAGNNKVIIVHVGLYRAASNIVFPSSVTYGGTTMTLIDTLNPDSAPVDCWGHAIYQCVIGSSVTTQTITVTGASYDEIFIQALCYKNVDQTTPIGQKAKATASSTNPNVSINPDTSFSMIVNFLMFGNVALTVTWNDSQTQRDRDQNITAVAVSDVLNKTNTTTTYDATLSSSTLWGFQGIELREIVTTTTSVQYAGKITSSGLTPNAKYYLSNTAGEISTSPGGTSVLLGKALSATELLIIQN
jgi:hypothetical protein